MIRLIDTVTFVVPRTVGARAPVVVEKFGAELRRAPAQFHHWTRHISNFNTSKIRPVFADLCQKGELVNAEASSCKSLAIIAKIAMTMLMARWLSGWGVNSQSQGPGFEPKST